MVYFAGEHSLFYLSQPYMGNKFIFVILENGYHKIMYKISKLILPSIDTLFLMYMASYVAVSVIFPYTILPVGCDTCMHKLI